MLLLAKLSSHHTASSTLFHKLSDYVPNVMFHPLQDETNQSKQNFSVAFYPEERMQQRRPITLLHSQIFVDVFVVKNTREM